MTLGPAEEKALKSGVAALEARIAELEAEVARRIALYEGEVRAHADTQREVARKDEALRDLLAEREATIRRECCPCNCHDPETPTTKHANCAECRQAVEAESERIEDELVAAAERRGLERAAEFIERVESVASFEHLATSVRALGPGGGK